MNYEEYRQSLNCKLTGKVEQELTDIYQEWIETDYSHMENLRQTVSG